MVTKNSRFYKQCGTDVLKRARCVFKTLFFLARLDSSPDVAHFHTIAIVLNFIINISLSLIVYSLLELRPGSIMPEFLLLGPASFTFFSIMHAWIFSLTARLIARNRSREIIFCGYLLSTGYLPVVMLVYKYAPLMRDRHVLFLATTLSSIVVYNNFGITGDSNVFKKTIFSLFSIFSMYSLVHFYKITLFLFYDVVGTKIL